MAAATVLGPAPSARAKSLLAAFNPIPATTNQANVTLSNTASDPFTGPSDVMTILSGSMLAFTYDTDTGVLELTRASLLGSTVHFSFGPAYHPCVVKTKIVEDRTDGDYPGQGFPDENGDFVMYVPMKFTGYVGNNCNGDETLYQDSLALVFQGTFSYDSGTGAMSVQSFSTPNAFGPITLKFANVTLYFTGTLTLNVSSTAAGTIFNDGFESGDTVEWTLTSP